MLPSASAQRGNTAVFKLCGGCMWWCPGGVKGTDPKFTWQNDVNDAMVSQRVADTIFKRLQDMYQEHI